MTVLRYIASRDLKKQVKLLLLVTISVLLGLAPIHLLRILFDRAIPTADIILLGVLAAGLLILVTVGAVVNYHLAVMGERIKEDFMANLRADLFNRLIRTHPEFYIRQSLGQIMNRLHTGVDRLGMSVASIFTDPIVHTTTLIFYIAYLISMNWKLALLALATLPFVALLVPRINRRISEITKTWNIHMAGVITNMQESFSGIFEVQAHATFNYESQRFRSRLIKFIFPNLDRGRYYALLAVLSDLSRGVGPVLVYIYGGYLAINNQMQVGQIIAFVTTLNGLYVSVDKLINYPPLLRIAQDRFIEILEYLELPQAFAEEQNGATLEGTQIEITPQGSAISLSRITFGYDTGHPTLENISLDIGPGEHVALVGPSGCGKSTALNIMAGRLSPHSGEVRIKGRSIGELPVTSRASAIGFVGQYPFLFNGTLRDNLLYALFRSENGDPDRPITYIDPFALGQAEISGSGWLDQLLVAICQNVGLGDELFEFGLESRLPAQDANLLLEVRKALGAVLSAERSLERFDPQSYFTRATVGENLVFAPHADGQILSDDTLIRWITVARRPEVNVIDLLVEIGWASTIQDLDYLARISAENPALLAEFGIERADLEERMRLADKVRSRGLTESALGAETYNALARRGLLAVETDVERRSRIVRAREAFGIALGKRAPAQYDPDSWHDNLTVRENLLFGRANEENMSATRRINARLRDAIESAGLKERVLSAGLDFEVGERGSRLSGGQRQKVSIARVLLKRAPIMLFDEATASLDQSSALKIHNLLSERYRNCTVVAVTHQLSLLGHFDRVVVFEKGKIAEQGTETELKARGGVLSRLLSAEVIRN
jgi:ABC-type multidrug transport system fused ATPase/permease subunit